MNDDFFNPITGPSLHNCSFFMTPMSKRSNYLFMQVNFQENSLPTIDKLKVKNIIQAFFSYSSSNFVNRTQFDRNQFWD